MRVIRTGSCLFRLAKRFSRYSFVLLSTGAAWTPRAPNAFSRGSESIAGLSFYCFFFFHLVETENELSVFCLEYGRRVRPPLLQRSAGAVSRSPVFRFTLSFFSFSRDRK